jgi:hypothetical protein
VVSNAESFKPFEYYLTRAREMVRTHGSVTLSGVGSATQHALVVSEVLRARGVGKVTAVRTSTLKSGESEHEAKIEVTVAEER